MGVLCVAAVSFMPVVAAWSAEPYAGDEEPLIAHIEASPEPAIHGPRVVGTTPGRPFIFLIPATGDAPLTFSARNLPKGLTLDENTGIIFGKVEGAEKSIVNIEVRNAKGQASRELAIIADKHKLALTPPMGWNPWNVWSRSIDDGKVRDAADWMVKSGLAAHGYQYVNVDDCWEGERDGDGVIQSNDRFPDMAALADYIHTKGLRFGIYSSPGEKTCADYAGSLGHEQADAKTYADWGADYLKYDWCSYKIASANLAEMQKPFKVMSDALDACERDIVYSLSQGGIANIWEWGAAVNANCWRTTGDICDTWESVSRIGFSQTGREKYAGPGHWNDPDMLVVGWLKWQEGPSRLTPAEQVTHVSLWSLLAAPLLVGCDLAQLDAFTLDLLTNDEVIDIDQDALGKAAARVAQCNTMPMLTKWLTGTFAEEWFNQGPHAWGDVWARPLGDGTMAVGLFNRGEVAGIIATTWDVLGLKGMQPVRDVWRHRELGEYEGRFAAMIPPHGAVLLKIGKPALK